MMDPPKTNVFKNAERLVEFKKGTCAACLQLQSFIYDKDNVDAHHFGNDVIESIKHSW